VGRMRIKKKHKWRAGPLAEHFVDEGDVLVAYRIPGSLAADRVAKVLSVLMTVGGPLEARMLAMQNGPDMLVVLNFLSQKEAALARENLDRNRPDGLLDAVVPEGRAEELVPLGRVFPAEVCRAAAELASQNPLYVESWIGSILDRPEGEDYVFDLPPELKEKFRKLRAERQKRPVS
jgi:hypothetical protein